MLRLLKNNVFRVVFAGLLLIMAFTIALLPKVFAAGDFSLTSVSNGITYAIDGAATIGNKIVVTGSGTTRSIYGYIRPTNYPGSVECNQYLTVTSIEKGDAIPAGAEFAVDLDTGDFSITSDTDMEFNDMDEVLNSTFVVSADAPVDMVCMTDVDIVYDYPAEIYTNFTHKVSRYQQSLEYAQTEVDKDVNDDDFINPLTETTVVGEITYSSNNEAVAKVDSATGEVQIMGVGVATITATAAPGYQYLETSTSYTLNVSKTISITDVSVPDKTYDGTTDTEVGMVTLSEAGLARDVDYIVSGVLDNANVGTGRRATVTVTLIGDAANNYVLDNNTFEVDDITIIPYTITSVNIFLEYYVTRHDGTEKEPGVTVKIGNFTVDSNEYTVGYADNIDVGTATVTVTAKDGANIASNAQETFEIVDRDILEISGITSPQTIAYTGLPVVLEGTLAVGPNTDGITVDDINIIWYESDGTTIISQPTDAGDYMVKYYYSGANYVGELLVSFTIERAESPEPAEVAELDGITIRAGKRLSEIEGVRTRGFRWENESTIIRAGRNVYRATYVYNDDATNYTVRHLDIVICGESDGGGDEGGDSDDDAVIVPDTGRFTGAKGETHNNTVVETIVEVALIVAAVALLAGGRFARNKIDFDKK